MDREYIENEHIVDRYLAGELTVREARDFEKYCVEHPELLRTLPIPVRLKARLARRPLAESETGMFRTIPSSATHAAVEANEEGFDPDEDREELRRNYGAGSSRIVVTTLVVVLLLALIAALGGLVAYARQAKSVSAQMQEMQRQLKATQVQAPGSVQTYRVRPVRGRPERATLAPGWLTPPQLLDLRVDVSEGKYSQFQVTIDKADGTRLMQIRRIARDSNKELRLGLNSSSFGPGELLIRFDGYTWRGKIEEAGWVRLDLK
jgi:hypothetical protein